MTAQLAQEDGGGDGRVAFIDTENTFRPERIVEICMRYELNADEVLENIIVARAYTSEMQIELLEHVAMQMSIAHFSLLIVDSATGLFRVDFTGRGELSVRQQKLNQFMSGLMKIAEQFNIAVFLTNQVQAVPDSMSFGPDKKPIGGTFSFYAYRRYGLILTLFLRMCRTRYGAREYDASRSAQGARRPAYLQGHGLPYDARGGGDLHDWVGWLYGCNRLMIQCALGTGF